MKEISCGASKDTPSGKGRILTGVFTCGEWEVKDCDVFSKLFAAGFELYHVGINPHSSVFIQKMKKFAPHVLILLSQGNVKGIQELIEVIKREQLRAMTRVILYGPGIEASVRDEVHADAYAESEQELFDMVNELVSETFL